MAIQRNIRQVIINVDPATVVVHAHLVYSDDEGFIGRQERQINAPAIVSDADALVQTIITAAENALGITLGRG